MAVGKVIVSTPYLYAEELLADGRGFLYPFRDTDVLATTVCDLLTNDKLFETTRRRAYLYGRSMAWQSVGLQYTQLLAGLLNERINRKARADALAILRMEDVEARHWASLAAA
jgi:glycosyltransferase involved in cell wall biosynthesis